MTIETYPLTKRPLSAKLRADLEYGWPLLLALAKFGVGRTLLIRNHSVLSVETIEGVADAIRRAGTVSKGGFLVLLNDNSDADNHEPVDTRIVQTMVDSGANALALAADYPITDSETVLRFADQQKIAVVRIK